MTTLTDENDNTFELTDGKLTEIMKTEFGIEAEELFTEPSRRTAPQIEKFIKGKAEKKRYSDLLLFSPQGGLTMASEKDKRLAISVNPGDDFSDDLED